MSQRYQHILNHPHHISTTRPHMSNAERAAQFGSFKALSGFEDEIEESARHVEKRLPMTEMQRDALDQSMQRLQEASLPKVAVTYFVPDTHKCGGSYVTYNGIFRFLELDTGKMKFVDGMEIAVQDVWEIRWREEDV